MLFGAPNFVATPHLGASTLEAQENVALQVAEQMADFLLTGAVSNALNSPSISADEAPKLRPYIALAERLGSFAGQMVDAGLSSVEILYEGDLARVNVKPLTSSALAAILRPMLSEVNVISAPAIAKERGITVTESRQELSPTYDSLMKITVGFAGGKVDLAGTVIGGVPRIVQIKGMDLDAPFCPDMIYVNNLDRPGFIGRLGTLFGDAGINISTFYLGRTASGDDAIALVGVDQPPDDPVLRQVKTLPNVKEVRFLRF